MSRVLDTFLDLVRISSPTGREAEVARYVEERLTAAGYLVRYDDTRAITGSDSGNLIVEVPGTAPGLTLAFAAHMDCVQPCEGVEPVVVDGVVLSAGETVLGGDDKIGVAAMLECALRLAESGEPHALLRLLFTVSEEDGLLGAKALAPADAHADCCLVLDADGPVGGIVIGAPTHYIFTAEFIGRAAHAGVEPEKGVSAIAMASAAIDAMALGRLDATTTANIGTISGGRADNIVAASCRITGECRSLDRARVEAVRDEMDAALKAGADRFGGTVEVEWSAAYEGFSVDEESAEVALVKSACADIGVSPHCYTTGGGSDANIFASHNIPTLVLGSGMTNVHSIDEEVEVVQIERLADLLLACVRRAVE